MQLGKGLKWIILLELIVPMALLSLGVYHGLIQTFYRAGMIKDTSFWGLEYYQGLTVHGVVNAIVLTTFFAVAFGNACIIYYLRKKPHLTWQWISMITMLVGTVMATAAMLTGEANVLYTFYPPLKAHWSFYAGAALLVIGSWIALFTWIPLYMKWRKENPGKKTPMAVVGTLANFFIWFVATLPLAYEVIVMLIPWSVGWTAEINIMLSRVLFWFFGHPLVYFWLLPVYIMFYVMLPKVAGGKLYSDYAGRLVFMLFIIFSIPVGLHHQYAEPSINNNLKFLHGIFTFGVAIPSLLTAFTLAASLEHAGVQNGARGLFGWMKKLPWFNKDRYLFAYLISGLIIFIFGGITGIVNASYSMNMVVHNTAWMPGHFHLTVAGPVFLGILAMSLHMTAKLTGREIKFKGLNLAVPYMWLTGLFFFSGALMLGGLLGEPRRTNLGLTYLNPESELYQAAWVLTTHTTVIGGILMFLTAVLFFIVFFGTLFGKKKYLSMIEFPTSEAYHDEKKIRLVKNFTPWIIIAIILILFAYIPTFMEAVNNPAAPAPPFAPTSPVPLELGN